MQSARKVLRDYDFTGRTCCGICVRLPSWNVLWEHVFSRWTFCSKVRENSKWRVRSKLRSEHVGGRPCPRWELLACPWLWRAARPHRPVDRRPTSCRRISQRLTKSFSARKKSQTWAWRRSMSSTRKTPRNLRWAKSSLGAVAAVVDAAVVDAAFDAVPAAAAAAASAGVGRGVVATPVRRQHFRIASTAKSRHGRLDQCWSGHSHLVSIASWVGCLAQCQAWRQRGRLTLPTSAAGAPSGRVCNRRSVCNRRTLLPCNGDSHWWR